MSHPRESKTPPSRPTSSSSPFPNQNSNNNNNNNNPNTFFPSFPNAPSAALPPQHQHQQHQSTGNSFVDHQQFRMQRHPSAPLIPLSPVIKHSQPAAHQNVSSPGSPPSSNTSTGIHVPPIALNNSNNNNSNNNNRAHSASAFSRTQQQQQQQQQNNQQHSMLPPSALSSASSSLNTSNQQSNNQQQQQQQSNQQQQQNVAGSDNDPNENTPPESEKGDPDEHQLMHEENDLQDEDSALVPAEMVLARFGDLNNKKSAVQIVRSWISDLIFGLYSFVFQCRKWLPPNYNFRQDLLKDVVAGTIMSVMLLPMGLAYATLMNITPILGVYSSAWYSGVYAIVGATAKLSMGPAAETTLMLMDAPNLPPPTDAANRVRWFLIVTLQVGIWTLLYSLMRGGAIIRNTLSRTVAKAYATAAGCLLVLTQIKTIFNLKLERSSVVAWDTLIQVGNACSDQCSVESIYSFLWFLVFVSYLLFVPKYLKEYLPTWTPHQLIIVVVAILVTWAFGLHQHGGLAILKDVPTPPIEVGVPSFTWVEFSSLLGYSALFSIVSFLQMYGIASTMNPDVNANQELFSQGACAVVASFLGGFAGCSSFSRCSVLDMLQAATPLNSLIACGLLVFYIEVLIKAGFFYYMPSVVLTAIIFAAVSGLIDFRAAHTLWSVSKTDFVVWLVTFLGVVNLGVTIGISSGIGLSILIVLFRVSSPAGAQLAYDARSGSYRSSEHDHELLVTRHLLLWEYANPLYFINVNSLKAKLEEAVEREHRSIEYLVLDLSHCPGADASAAESFNIQVSSLKKSKKVELFVVVGIFSETRQMFKALPSLNFLLFESVLAAVEYANSKIKSQLPPTLRRVPRAVFESDPADITKLNNALVAAARTSPADRRVFCGAIALISHGYRTPKQKLKAEFCDPELSRLLFGDVQNEDEQNDFRIREFGDQRLSLVQYALQSAFAKQNFGMAHNNNNNNLSNTPGPNNNNNNSNSAGGKKDGQSPNSIRRRAATSTTATTTAFLDPLSSISGPRGPGGRGVDNNNNNNNNNNLDTEASREAEREAYANHRQRMQHQLMLAKVSSLAYASFSSQGTFEIRVRGFDFDDETGNFTRILIAVKWGGNLTGVGYDHSRSLGSGLPHRLDLHQMVADWFVLRNAFEAKFGQLNKQQQQLQDELAQQQKRNQQKYQQQQQQQQQQNSNFFYQNSIQHQQAQNQQQQFPQHREHNRPPPLQLTNNNLKNNNNQNSLPPLAGSPTGQQQNSRNVQQQQQHHHHHHHHTRSASGNNRRQFTPRGSPTTQHHHHPNQLSGTFSGGFSARGAGGFSARGAGGGGGGATNTYGPRGTAAHPQTLNEWIGSFENAAFKVSCVSASEHRVVDTCHAVTNAVLGKLRGESTTSQNKDGNTNKDNQINNHHHSDSRKRVGLDAVSPAPFLSPIKQREEDAMNAGGQQANNNSNRLPSSSGGALSGNAPEFRVEYNDQLLHELPPDAERLSYLHMKEVESLLHREDSVDLLRHVTGIFSLQRHHGSPYAAVRGCITLTQKFVADVEAALTNPAKNTRHVLHGHETVHMLVMRYKILLLQLLTQTMHLPDNLHSARGTTGSSSNNNSPTTTYSNTAASVAGGGGNSSSNNNNASNALNSVSENQQQQQNQKHDPDDSDFEFENTTNSTPSAPSGSSANEGEANTTTSHREKATTSPPFTSTKCGSDPSSKCVSSNNNNNNNNNSNNNNNNNTQTKSSRSSSGLDRRASFAFDYAQRANLASQGVTHAVPVAPLQKDARLFKAERLKDLYDNVAYDAAHNSHLLRDLSSVNLQQLTGLLGRVYRVISAGNFGLNDSEKRMTSALAMVPMWRRIQREVRSMVDSLGSDSSTLLLPFKLMFCGTIHAAAFRNTMAYTLGSGPRMTDAAAVNRGGELELSEMAERGWHFMAHFVIRVFRIFPDDEDEDEQNRKEKDRKETQEAAEEEQERRQKQMEEDAIAAAAAAANDGGRLPSAKTVPRQYYDPSNPTPASNNQRFNNNNNNNPASYATAASAASAAAGGGGGGSSSRPVFTPIFPMDSTATFEAAQQLGMTSPNQPHMMQSFPSSSSSNQNSNMNQEQREEAQPQRPQYEIEVMASSGVPLAGSWIEKNAAKMKDSSIVGPLMRVAVFSSQDLDDFVQEVERQSELALVQMGKIEK